MLLLVGMVQAGAGVARHRFAVGNWLVATFRTQQLVSPQAATARRVAAGAGRRPATW